MNVVKATGVQRKAAGAQLKPRSAARFTERSEVLSMAKVGHREVDAPVPEKKVPAFLL